MSVAKLVWRNAHTWKKELEAEEARVISAARVALRIEGFRLKREMQREIRQAAPGGKHFAPLRAVSRFMGRAGAAQTKPPLHRLAIPVRYWEDVIGRDYSVSVGYQDKPVVNIRYRGALAGLVRHRDFRSRDALSKSWLRIARSQQRGFSFPAGDKTDEDSFRRELFERGVKLKKMGWPENITRFFFLKPSTSRIRVPARPIVEPFEKAHAFEAMRNIRNSFERKMRGERVSGATRFPEQRKLF
jgi:hypothetical protein